MYRILKITSLKLVWKYYNFGIFDLREKKKNFSHRFTRSSVFLQFCSFILHIAATKNIFFRNFNINNGFSAILYVITCSRKQSVYILEKLRVANDLIANTI